MEPLKNKQTNTSLITEPNQVISIKKNPQTFKLRCIQSTNWWFVRVSPGKRWATVSPAVTASRLIPWWLSIPCPGGDDCSNWCHPIKVMYYTSFGVCSLGGVKEKHFRVSTIAVLVRDEITPMKKLLVPTPLSLTVFLYFLGLRVLKHGVHHFTPDS